MTYFKNTILNYSDIETDEYVVSDYTSRDLSKFHEYVQTLDDDIFTFYQMVDDDKLERISLEIYGNPDYWDIILLLNNRNPLFELALNFDTLSDMSDDKISLYEEESYKQEVPDLPKALMKEAFLKTFEEDNEVFRVLRIVKPSRIYEFLQGGYEGGYF